MDLSIGYDPSLLITPPSQRIATPDGQVDRQRIEKATEDFEAVLLTILIRQMRLGEQLGAPLVGPKQRLAATPPGDLGVIARQEYLRHLPSSESRRPRVLGMLKQPC